MSPLSPTDLSALPRFPDLSDASPDEFGEAHRDYAFQTREAFGIQDAIWEVDQVDFSHIAFPGEWRLVHDDHWGPCGAVMSPLMTDPTWLDIFIACDWAMAQSTDLHHIFIESVYSDGRYLRLTTGS